MHVKQTFRIVLLAVFFSFFLLIPQHSYAQTPSTGTGTTGAGTTTAGTNVGGAGAGVNCDCGQAVMPGGFDYSMTGQDAQQSAASFQQQKFAAMQKAIANIPMLPAVNQCLQNVMNAFKALSNLASMSSAGSIQGVIVKAVEAAAEQIVTNLVNQACSQVTGAVGSITSSITNLAKICLPMPNFNLNQFGLGSLSGCSNGMVIPLLGQNGGGAFTQYNYQQYQR